MCHIFFIYSSISEHFGCFHVLASVNSAAVNIEVHDSFCFFNKFIYFIYLFLAVLGLCCCMRAFSSCGDQGLLFVAVRGFLIVVAALVAEHGL